MLVNLYSNLHTCTLTVEDGNLVQDLSESLAVIGRYISENYDGVALHPIDFIDMSTGKLVAEVMNTDITTISPVTKLHPRDDVLASGSSRFISFIYIMFCLISDSSNVLFFLSLIFG